MHRPPIARIRRRLASNRTAGALAAAAGSLRWRLSPLDAAARALPASPVLARLPAPPPANHHRRIRWRKRSVTRTACAPMV